MFLRSAISVYIHIPFCIRKCLYCDFNSYPGMEDLFDKYVEALKADIRLESARSPNAHITTIYVGGGTPTMLAAGQLASILEEAKAGFRVDPDAETTVEANPGVGLTSPPTSLRSGDGSRQSAAGGLRSAGFNRISLGIQSLHDVELRLLGRIHTADEAVRAFHAARVAGFEHISIDLMYGIPGQTLESWRQTLKGVLKLGPEHVSLYSLTVEEDTPFRSMSESGNLPLPGEDAEADMYEMAIDMLTAAGFRHYEISNFARPGYECRHNLTYWRNEPYFGFGAGATSCLDGVRSTHVLGVEEYIRRIKAGESTFEFRERLEGRESMGETLFLGLRMLGGVDVTAFTHRYGLSPHEVFPAEIGRLLERGLIEDTGDLIRLTRPGLLFANDVFSEFVGRE